MRGDWGDNFAMADARPLFLALALEAAPLGVVRQARFAWRRSAYVVTLVLHPDNVGHRIAAARAGPPYPGADTRTPSN